MGTYTLSILKRARSRAKKGPLEGNILILPKTRPKSNLGIKRMPFLV